VVDESQPEADKDGWAGDGGWKADPVVEAEPEVPEEPEDVTLTLDEFMKQREELRQKAVAAGLATKDAVRKVDTATEFAGLTLKEKTELGDYLPDTYSKPETLGKKDQRSSAKAKVLDVGFKSAAPTYENRDRFAGGRGDRDGNSYRPREGGDSYRPREGGDSYRPREGGDSYRPREGGDSYRPREGGDSYRPREGGDSYRPREGGDSYRPREGGDSYRPREGGDSYRPREGGDSYRPREGGDSYRPRDGGRGRGRSSRNSGPETVFNSLDFPAL